MKNGKNESRKTPELAALLAMIDRIGPEYVNGVSDEIFKHQPFFLTVLLGYRFDVSPQQLEEIMKIYFLIWEYFKKNPKLWIKQVTEKDFEAAQHKHIQMLKYAEGETEESRAELYSDNWDTVQSSALIAVIYLRFKERPVLLEMNQESKGIILVGIKSFMECFERL